MYIKFVETLREDFSKGIKLLRKQNTEKLHAEMWQTWINSMGGFKEICCVIYLELPLFNTTKPYER
jgi:hypothetical protein